MPTRRKESSRPPAGPTDGEDGDLEDERQADDNADDAGASERARRPTASDEGADEEVEDEAPGEPEDLDAAADDADSDSDTDADGDTGDDDGGDDDDDDRVVEIAAPARPAGRPSPGRPPSAKEEPEPPFFIGERVRLVKNTRPRTGSPIADHPVGATGRVETVLSQTAIVRFDRAPDTKEVVAFICLESLDEEAMARRAERDRQAARG